MIGIFHTITIDGTEIYRGNEFTLQREMIFAGEIETCTGDRHADLVGWRYADLTVNWDALPEDQMAALLALTGESVSMSFADAENNTVTETVIPRTITATATRHTRADGSAIWKGVGLQLTFLESHH